ncbi:Hsp20/alpha crystallin family protein [Sediminicola luteus]|jgi:HSP20 family protein|uniref:SHSP domain-containing protein n=1 Tax=Sediminicola luteus TaxID=319238 RepID=A0A2A4G763_9FLAO|nr:Hsp20/alpha crystallin family protein [Sediminicola luteus]PCE64273.1 hypothetical protein B7P33_08190 [Sediminicola luteus]
MNIVKRNDAFLPSILDEMFKPDWFGGTESRLAPMDISETDSAFALAVELPGRKKEDIKVTVDKGVLTLATEANKEKIEEGVRYTKREITHYAYKRSFSLPDSVDIEKIGVSYEAGILRLDMPKKAELVQPKRTFEVR